MRSRSAVMRRALRIVRVAARVAFALGAVFCPVPPPPPPPPTPIVEAPDPGGEPVENKKPT